MTKSTRLPSVVFVGSSVTPVQPELDSTDIALMEREELTPEAILAAEAIVDEQVAQAKPAQEAQQPEQPQPVQQPTSNGQQRHDPVSLEAAEYTYERALERVRLMHAQGVPAEDLKELEELLCEVDQILDNEYRSYHKAQKKAGYVLHRSQELLTPVLRDRVSACFTSGVRFEGADYYWLIRALANYGGEELISRFKDQWDPERWKRNTAVWPGFRPEQSFERLEKIEADVADKRAEKFEREAAESDQPVRQTRQVSQRRDATKHRQRRQEIREAIARGDYNSTGSSSKPKKAGKR